MKAVFFDSIDNTQDYALENFEQEPLLVISYFQEKGRGTDNRDWENADQALACSLVFNEVRIIFGSKVIQLLSFSRVFLGIWPCCEAYGILIQ